LTSAFILVRSSGPYLLIVFFLVRIQRRCLISDVQKRADCERELHLLRLLLSPLVCIFNFLNHCYEIV